MTQKPVYVKPSKAHRNKAHDVKGYRMKPTQNVHRNKAHYRRARRTKAQIAADEAKQRAKAAKKTTKKTTQVKKGKT